MSEETRNVMEKDVDHTPVYRLRPEQPITTAPQTSMAASKLVQTFGLDARAAVLVTLVDLMMFGVDIVSAGAFIIMGVLVAAVLGFIVYKIQRQWFGDDHESSLIKSLIVALVTAIPAPLTPLIAVPAGALGLLRLLGRKAS